MQWVCEICGYVHEEEEKPDSCPVCGAPASKFTEWTPEDESDLDDYTLDDDEDDQFEKDLFGDYDE